VENIVVAVISMVFWLVMLLVVNPMVTPTIITGTDTGSMVVKGFIGVIIALAAIASPIVILAKAWHDKDKGK
jgi:uncharacterized membrane protein YhaH (DUF805 family)